MTNALQKILSERYWPEQPAHERKILFDLFLTWTSAGVFAFLLLVYNFIFNALTSCFLCDFLLITITALAIISVLNAKINFVQNLAFTVPLVVYSYFISDFNPQNIENQSIYVIIFWLYFGLFYLILFADTYRKPTIYLILAELILVFQMQKTNVPANSFDFFRPIIIHPVFLFFLLFIFSVLLRNYYQTILKKQEEQIRKLSGGILKVMQDTPFLVAQIAAERDEAGNVIQFRIEKVNHSFESGFKINLYEVQGQNANYIFNLIFKNKFDIHKIIFSDLKKYREFYTDNFDKWYFIHVLQPEYNRFYLIFEDISNTKLKIAELEENKQRYKVLLEAIPDIFFVIGKDGTFEDFVIKENDLFKIKDANLVGSTIFEVGFPENMADKIYSCIQNSIKTNSVETLEYSMNTPNGTFLFEMRLAKLNENAVISIARDITKRKTAEFNLVKRC